MEQKQIKKRVCKEVPFKGNEGFKTLYGTTTANQRVVYIKARTWLKPLSDKASLSHLQKAVSVNKLSSLHHSDIFEPNTLINISVAEGNATKNKNTQMSVEMHLKQKGSLKLKDAELSDALISVSNEVIEQIMKAGKGDFEFCAQNTPQNYL